MTTSKFQSNHSLVPTVSANGLELYYEEIGHGRPVILIMGLGTQMVFWDEELRRALADRGFRVIAFDNRDIGLSTRLRHLPVPDLRPLLLRAALGLTLHPPYTLSDMAADTVALMDALGIERAHVVGLSMGGMIAQLMAIEHPERVHTLTSIMAHASDPLSRLVPPGTLRVLLGPFPRQREQAIERQVELSRVLHGTGGLPYEAERIRALAGLAYDRGLSPRGLMRQLAAIGAARNRVSALGSVRAPSLIIHGTHDPLVLPRAAKVLARALPGSRLCMIPRMGHSTPRSTWPTILDEIGNLAGQDL